MEKKMVGILLLRVRSLSCSLIPLFSTGCATFFKREKFMLYDKHELEMNEIALDQPLEQRPRFSTNNVALFLVERQ
jgi:hypothetical protein